ncbi:hypothetical protein [Mesorhizobium sp.]|uniref:hypothetical protein n=1 Tax=Mesorhizobium sp. TaxID=1871066 RepID=UPI000FE7FDB5|nr:hypothetical protein [Mesorhizobium sp.]RWP64873.1 MAG: hypothetical protein EOR08_08135 [Mesorhizobium sp.]
MTARDAIDRLNRSRSQIRGELPDRAPLDHIERMFDTKQPQKDRRVCHHFPGWLCGDECIDILPARSPAVRRILAVHAGRRRADHRRPGLCGAAVMMTALVIWLVALLPISIGIGNVLASRSKMYPEADTLEHRPVTMPDRRVPA